MPLSALLAGLLMIPSAPAEDTRQPPAHAGTAPDSKVAPSPQAGEAGSASRPKLDSAAQRNENVPVYQIDNNVVKELQIRLGDSVTIFHEPPVEMNHFAVEHGQPTGEAPVLKPAPAAPKWHSESFWWHQNSIFNARTFFQVGGVKPSHRNGYGTRYTGSLGRFGDITATAAQTKIRGMVNGNVLVPLASERTPLTADPAAAALIRRYFTAYPETLPNRLDFDPRALNTNAPQRSDEMRGDLRWDLATGARSRFSASHSLSRQRVDAFQLVAGQNPDTEIHSHRTRLTWRYDASPATALALGFTFGRVKSLLLPEPNAVGPRVRFGYQIEELGPDSQFPINRAENTFRYGAVLTHQASGGKHALTFGGDLRRLRLNGIEANNHRGYFQFSNNFGRTAIDNLRYGTPTTYEATVGELARGYRNWAATLFAADRWRLGPRLQIYYGLRYSLDTAPAEVRGLDAIPYRCDCNNVGPRVSLAYQAGAGIVLRASYTVSFAEIQPVTYQQVRNNPPHVFYVQVQNPDLLDPLRGIDFSQASIRHSPTLLSPDLVDPYSHQYNLSLERRLWGASILRLGYVGSRTMKTINSYVQNRADPVPGLPLTTANVDDRRPDPRYYEVKHIVNGGIAYLDAVQASYEAPHARGVTWGATYTFGKAIDEGSDYSGTAANKDLLNSRAQWQYESLKDKKGLSTFDSTHSLQFYYSYELPHPVSRRTWLAGVLNGWQIAGAALIKSGTPLTLFIGSDAPGFGNVDGGPSDRPNILDASILGATFSDPNTAPLILRRDRFGYIVPGEHRGSLGRNTFHKSGIANFNSGLGKHWRWSRSREWTALLRAEALNLTNHPQFDEPQRNLTSPSFGRITNTLNDGRIVQLSLRLLL